MRFLQGFYRELWKLTGEVPTPTKGLWIATKLSTKDHARRFLRARSSGGTGFVVRVRARLLRATSNAIVRAVQARFPVQAFHELAGVSSAVARRWLPARGGSWRSA